MLNYIYTLPWAVVCAIFMAAAIALSLVGLIIVRRCFHHSRLKPNNEVAGFAFSVIALFYALQLGFTMVNVQNRFESLHQTIDSEADNLANLYRDAAVFPEETRHKIRLQIRDYINQVINEEWTLMREGKVSFKAADMGHMLWHIYYDYTPTTEKEKIWYTQSIDRLNTLNHLRLERLYFSTRTLDPMMWTLLFGGALMTIGFMYLFGNESFAAQAIMISILSGLIAFLILTVISFDNAFIGTERIDPNAFRRVLSLFEIWK